MTGLALPALSLSGGDARDTQRGAGRHRLLLAVSAGAAALLFVSERAFLRRGVGAGTARTNLGRSLAVSEALVGQIYLVTMSWRSAGGLVPRNSQVP